MYKGIEYNRSKSLMSCLEKFNVLFVAWKIGLADNKYFLGRSYFNYVDASREKDLTRCKDRGARR